MTRFSDIFNNLVAQSLRQLYEFITKYGPGIAFALAVIFLGWLLAVLIRKIAAKLFRALGFDVLSEKTGLKSFLERGGIKKRPSALIGSIFYWIILFNALIMAQDAVDLKITSQFIQQVILYIPNIIVVILLIALSVFISRFISRLVDKTSQLADIPFHAFLGTVARYAVVGLAAMLALQYLNVPAKIVSNALLIIFGVVPSMCFLIFVIAGRDIISNVLNGKCLMKDLKAGDTIECDSISGRIEEIGLTATRLKNNSGEMIIPNSDLAKKIIKKK